MTLGPELAGLGFGVMMILLGAMRVLSARRNRIK